MISVGIDVSERKSMAAIISLEGEVIHSPFKFEHTQMGLQSLLDKIISYPIEDVRFILESTGVYHLGILNYLTGKGYFVHVANPMLMKKYFDVTIRKVKTDKKDAWNLSLYGSEKWYQLSQYCEQDKSRHDLQTLHRQYIQHTDLKSKVKVQLKNLIELSFPGIEKILTDDYYGLLLDVYEAYPSANLVVEKNEEEFIQEVTNMAKARNHRKGVQLAQEVYHLAKGCITSEPSIEILDTIVKQCIAVVRSSEEATKVLMTKMQELAETMPEYEIVRNMTGVGVKLAPRLIAEIGDISRFKDGKSLVAFTGIDSPPYQSGRFESTNRRISKRGSACLRRCGYEVMLALKRGKPKVGDAVYEFILKKEREGKPKKVAKIAGLNKFLRIYYARVKEVYN